MNNKYIITEVVYIFLFLNDYLRSDKMVDDYMKLQETCVIVNIFEKIMHLCFVMGLR